MKTIRLLTLILSAASIFQVSSLFAAKDGVPPSPNNELKNIYSALAPTVLCEATFEDDAVLTDYAGLAPVAPMDATFNDDNDSNDILISQNLLPVTPSKADFNDDFDLTVDFKVLAPPTTPVEADFSDSL
jgi:hypothetical protein